jgi:beta-lactamase regulating signal transducer with metallopeptidase domain
VSAFAAYLLAVSVLFAGGAWASEQAFLVRRWPLRFLWLTTLLASVLFPFGMALNTAPSHTMVRQRPPAASLAFLPLSTHPFLPNPPRIQEPRQAHRPVPAPAEPAAAPTGVSDAPSSPAARAPVRVSPGLIVGVVWLSASIATALWYLLAAIRLARLVRRAPRASIQGTAVRITPAGPAVFGVFRPTILWPRWLDEAPAATRAAALAHETQHLAAGDPLLLAAGLFLVVLAPWNPALWWQLRRMRFAMEVDCDRRVLRRGCDEQSYAQALLQIAQARVAGGAALAVLMSAPSWLEQRIRILLRPPDRRTVRLAALAVPLALAACVTQLPAPALHGAELRKLPPQDTRPGADWARAIARARYPELFDRHFDGTAVVAAMFNADGTLRLMNEHRFAPGVPPSDLELEIENARAGVDPLNDVYYAGQERGEFTIGPWLDTVNTGRVLVVYEVLGRAPDPSRSSARAEAALRAYAPELFVSQSAGTAERPARITLFMNDDGTVARLSRTLNGDYSLDAVGHFAVLEVPQERLGRGGVFYIGRTGVDYAWPRRLDDPPGMWNVYGYVFADAEPLLLPEPREDRDDEARIAQRYFHDLQLKGPAAVTETVAGHTIVRTPWILFGRDGRVWEAGLYSYQDWPAASDGLPGLASMALQEELEDRYPGIRVQFVGRGLRIGGVEVATAWIAPDSPIQRKADVDLQTRKNFLVTAVPFQGHNPLPPPMVAAADLHVPAEMSYGRSRYASVAGLRYLPRPEWPVPGAASWLEVTVTQVHRERITMNVRAQLPWTAPHPGSWTQTVTVVAADGQATVVELPGDTPDPAMRLLLRVERLKS